MKEELAECGNLSRFLETLGKDLDQYLEFDHPDAMADSKRWKKALGGALPEKGVGARQVISDMGRHLIPNGSAVPKPGCTSYITTGATTVGALASLSGTVASPQRFGLTAFNYLEELSLQWMAELFELPIGMKGLYSSGGSVANLIALGAARQAAFEKLGVDVAQEGLSRPGRIYASSQSHHSVHRAAAVMGMGRASVVEVPVDDMGRMCCKSLKKLLMADREKGIALVAIVANAGTTNTGAIDPLDEIGTLAREFGTWLHVDGAYGLPGILDPQVRPLFKGLDQADSVIVDPHKWLGAPVGIGATFVRDRAVLERAFSQGNEDYLQSSFSGEAYENSMESLGIPYNDFGVELSAPARGAVVWALIKEVGVEGLRERVCRHNHMARHLAQLAHAHPRLEVVLEPTLSICCFRYVSETYTDQDELNRQIHRRLVLRGVNIPSTTMIKGKLVIRPCFIGARTLWYHVESLLEEVIALGDQLVAEAQ